MSDAILLVNLGSPDSTSVRDVRKYLKEFLMDKYVIDIPWLIRKFLVSVIILPFRPRKSAEAYRKIFTSEGSPLVFLTERMAKKLQREVKLPVYVAMRYGSLSIQKRCREIKSAGHKSIKVVLLYPHYATSSFETARQEIIKSADRAGLQVKILEPFFDNPLYLDALSKSIKPYVSADASILFSYHGIPERQISKLDDTTKDCQFDEKCCEVACKERGRQLHACYRAQCYFTSKAMIDQLKLAPGQSYTSFQSRLGRNPWIKPYTDHVLDELRAQKVSKLVVVCPSFVVDCLETLEEIGIRGRDQFLSAGGSSLQLVPCMNDSDTWIKALAAMVMS